MYKRFAAAVLAVSITNAAMAQDRMTTSKFLSWSPEGQQSYINTAAMMAGVIATQNRQAQAKCIGNWAAANEKTGYKPIIDAMKRLPDYHPIAIISAVFEKECGSFQYAATASAQP